MIADGNEYEDGNGLTWEVRRDLTIERGRDEPRRGALIVRRFLDSLVTAGSLPSDVREAFDVILQDA